MMWLHLSSLLLQVSLADTVVSSKQLNTPPTSLPSQPDRRLHSPGFGELIDG